MLHDVRTVIVGLTVGAFFSGSPLAAQAGLIAALSLDGQAAINVQFDGNVLSTDSPQDTDVDFQGFLDGLDDIPNPPSEDTATFTLEGLTKSGSVLVFDTQVIQKFTGGTFSLRHPDGTLLLSGSLWGPVLTGTIGLPGGMLFTTSFSTVTGGTLAPYLDSSSLILQMHMSNINGGAGLTAPTEGMLGAFTAVATADIEAFEATAIPEPTAGALLVLCVALRVLSLPRTRRG